MTLLEVLTAAAGYLKDRGVESPRLNAEHLLAHVLGKKRLDLYLEFDHLLSDEKRATFRELVRARGTGRPPFWSRRRTVEFFGRSFLSDLRALVPRPETEQLVERVIHFVRGRQQDTKILDIGTGAGVIAITLALELPHATVAATEISLEALDLARENAKRYSAIIDFYEADLLPPTVER
jgi:release factor glutamine methyltransferase